MNSRPTYHLSWEIVQIDNTRGTAVASAVVDVDVESGATMRDPDGRRAS